MSTWVETVGPENVDLETIAANRNTIKINDVNDGISEKIAVHSINSSNAANARTLKAEGMAEIIANSTNNPASTGLSIRNDSTDDGVHILEARAWDKAGNLGSVRHFHAI